MNRTIKAVLIALFVATTFALLDALASMLVGWDLVQGRFGSNLGAALAGALCAMDRPS